MGGPHCLAPSHLQRENKVALTSLPLGGKSSEGPEVTFPEGQGRWATEEVLMESLADRDDGSGAEGVDAVSLGSPTPSPVGRRAVT